VRCKECSAEFPVLREFCPNCGAPADPGLRESQRLLGQGRQQRPEGEPNPKRKGFLVAAAVVLGLGIMGNNWFGSGFRYESDDSPGLFEPRGTVTIEADQLYKAYRDNPDEAEDRFEGREMVVSGEFVRIVPDGYGSHDLRLKTSDPGAEVGVDLAELAIEDGKKLLPGQRVTVSCQGMGDGGDELWVRDCAIQPTAETGATAPAPTPVSAAPASPAAPAEESNPE
jgi:hypothetical protein